MPGHIKKLTGPDPDPSPWLAVSAELKAKNKNKPYDPKKSVWVPNKAEGGYLEGLIESTDGAKVSVEVKVVAGRVSAPVEFQFRRGASTWREKGEYQGEDRTNVKICTKEE